MRQKGRRPLRPEWLDGCMRLAECVSPLLPPQLRQRAKMELMERCALRIQRAYRKYAEAKKAAREAAKAKKKKGDGKKGKKK